MTRNPDGELDQGWGTAGTLFDDISVGNTEFPIGGFWDSAGRLVTATKLQLAGGNKLVISRYSSTGGLDGTFADSGRSLIDLGESENINGIILNGDGSFWAYGDKGVGLTTDLLVALIGTDGRLDNDFDSDGWKTLNRDGWEWISNITKHPNGGFIASAGYASGGEFRLRLLRFTDDFDVDSTWNTGLGTFDVPGEREVKCSSLTISNDGGSICAGYRELTATDIMGIVIKRTADGRPDASFGGGDGIVEISAPGHPMLALGAVQPQADGAYFVVGKAGASAADTIGFVARLSASGALDTTFSTDGSMDIDLGGDVDDVSSIEPTANGGYLFFGVKSTTANKAHVVLGQLRADLSLDARFGTGGLKPLDIAPGNAVSVITAINIDEERTGLMGVATNGGPVVSAITVLANDSTPNYDLGNADWNDGAGAFGACLRTVGGTATAAWNTNNTCPATDGNYWYPIAEQPQTIADNSTYGANTGSASLRFGFRPKADQTPGQYSARLMFTVVAPEIV
jgi:uncharacterized delta-60 repeat protein